MPASMWEWWIGLWLLLEVLGGTCLNLDYRDDRSCNRSRQVMSGSWGVITDGPKSYPEASHCQWLIRGQVPGQHITLNVTTIDTECSYDHLYIYDGETYNSPKLGVFSGNTVPPPVTASSGSMLILLYSDTNYVLDGFVAEYSITDCPLNCSSHGICKENTGTCICDELYTGSGCEYQRCPENCGFAYNRGHCSKPQSTSRDPNPSPYCLCNEGYFGDGCSLSVFDNEGGSWSWVWHGGDPLHGRASHATVYLPHMDQLYLYGGYDLNNILGDLLIFDFNTSVWVNVSDPASQNQLSRRLNSKITARVKGMTEQLNVDNSHSTLLRNITFSVNSNNTVSVKLKNLMGETPRKKRMIRPSEELNHTPASQSVKGINPGPRYGHVMEVYDRHFVLFGGKLPSGEVSNELWLYNTTLDEWRLLEGQQDSDLVAANENTPPGLMHATLTLVDGSWLYLFGGSLEHGEFSSRMYRINLDGGRIWERVTAKGGNEHEARVVGHSAVFHAASRSLLIYGGIRVDVPRFSKLSDRLLVFDVDKHYWSQIHYPQDPKEESQVPLERAFHTAVIAGNYMVVFGGYLHKHKKEEKCYDDKLYLYHLGCHTWVSEQLTLTSVSGTYPKGQGIYGHTAFLRDGNTMVVVAGFHGSVSSHVLAYVLPSTLVSATGRELDMDEACRRHDAEGSCVSNLECGWCPTDKACYERSRGANCTNNLQTSQCPGICPSLHFCQSCTIHGRLARRSPCAWCVQTGKCHEQVETSGAQIRCGSPDDNPLGQEGWWGPTGDDLVSPQECRLKNFAPGITFIKYRHPVDLTRPDAVVIMNTTKIELRDPQEFKGAREIHAGGTSVAQFLGFIHPGVDEEKDFLLNVNTSGLNASVWVSLDDTEEELEELDLVNSKAQRPGRQPIFPSVSTGRRRYLTKVHMNQQISPSNNKNGMISITWNAHTHSAMELNIVALEPYSNGGASCSLQNTCLACLTDAKCGWCGASNKCVDRRDLNLQCKAVNSSNSEDQHFFTLIPEHCVTCEQHIYCDDCVGSGQCEWLPDEAYCSRKGRFPGAVMEVGKCPAPCHKRKSCASCLGDPGRCAWCQETKECFLFSVYTSVYQYGSCRVWLDEDHTNVTSPLLTTAPSPAEDPEVIGTTLPYLSTSVPMHTTSLGSLALDTSECHLCESLQGCDACLKSLDCGWCYNVYNPTIGICTAGDFSNPSRGGCDALVEPHLQAAIDNSSFMVDPQADWAYAVCPDVDECKLNLHNCHPNATCTNTHPGFNCTCKRGFKENSQGTCERTCNETCHYGYCSGPPDYQCLCHLGWTGSDCATNCECNNHSTCNISVGICDQCQDWTTGDFCHLCKPGSYGNATTKGCERCNCNDHSNESLGRCNQETGQCYCIDNTHGRKCEKCLPGFYGDPRNGGRCYRECSARNILYNAEEGNLGAQIGGLISRDCLWILTPHDSLEPLPTVATGRNVIQISIEDININCEDGILYIYDGLPDFVSRDPRWDRPSRILGAFCANQALYPVTVQSTSGFMTVYYKKNKALQGFNASYEVLQCTDNAGAGRICENEKPMCKDNFSGVHCDVKICPNRCSEAEGKGSCDEAYGRCKCAAGFVGEDCSIVQQGHHVVVTDLFVPDKISYSLSHLTKVLPRMGHSMVVDHLDSLWIFGGYSLSRGPLNDIRQFDTGNKTWVQLTVNVEIEDKPPPSRYFHAAAYVVIHREMYIYGGLNQTDFLGDFWRFNFETESWKRMETHPELPPLAGHTLTYRNDAESQSLVLIGGASSSYGFSDQVWEYNLRDGQWHKVETKGARPLGIYGHSTVYHKSTKTFYVHGGHSFKVERVGQSSDLYALDYNQKKWSILPTDHRINHNPASLPAPRSFHSAITTEDYMVVIGGHITDHLDSNQGLLVYSYKCNMWIPLNNRFITLVGPEIVPYIGTSAAIHGSSIYIFGGYFGTPQGSMTEITIPTDLCTLNANKTQCRDRIGCANCVVYESERTNTSYCYSNTKEEPSICQSPPKGKSSVVGVRCDKELLEKHDCYQHTSCTECLAEWPAHPNTEQGCQWCFNCSKGKCIPRENNCSEENYCDSRDGGHGVFIIDSDKCYENACQASDCDKCLNLRSECIWTRQVKQTSELDFHLHVKPKYNWNCVKETIKRHLSYVVQSAPPEQCPWRCHHHTTCTDCLNAEGAEGGWQECRWSPSLQQCFSPSFVTLRCVGGACGAVLSEGSHMCPKPCEKFTMCASCLANPHCGWCAQDSKITGVGICTEGLLEGPLHGTCQDHINRSITNTSLTSPAPHRLRHNNHVSWHYDVCPPEDECKNMHHTCDQKSQQCVDQTVGFECICALGYNQTEDGRCSPVCSQGCLAGTCIEPNNCSCNFGYVGGDCSIKCECNGHSECAGEDQLNVCLKCHNNTMGERCEKCKTNFVGDPSNGGQCMSCFDYCNKHTNSCVAKDVFDKAISSIHPSFYSSDKNMSESDPGILNIFKFLNSLNVTEGAVSEAVCLACGGNTTKGKCADCLPGFFRGTQDLSQPCRPCQCNGHGTKCDQVWGTKCNCGNNTESVCSSKGRGAGTEKEDEKVCWQQQCSKCKESYLGNPSNGHQCFMQMGVEKEYCLDPHTQNNCKTKPTTLRHGQTVYFAVQPKFMNVDIRLILDITKGGADVYFSSREDTFVVSVNQTTWQHKVTIDTNYPIAQDEAPIMYTAPVKRNYVGTGFDLFDFSGFTINHKKEMVVNKTQQSVTEYHLIEKPAVGLKTFATVSRSSDILIVRNVSNRLVITLPQNQHDLKTARFYVIVYGIGTENEVDTLGSIFFRQDQPRIDLFVFFSVFFSCFFLFLAVCVVVWKIKQGVDIRRARRRHVVEMQHMAKRPFADTTLVLHAEDDLNTDAPDITLDPIPWSPGRRKRTTKKERYGDSVDVGPLAVEPTDDGVAAVLTVMVQLPGGGIGNMAGGEEGPTHRLALGSSLCLMARIYPPASRPFHLRRRTSHMAA